MDRRIFLKAIGGGLTASMVAGFAGLATIGAVHAATVFKSSDNVAINGYDPVGYFNMSKPVKGVSDFKSEYDGAAWMFSSADNKALFDANPEKYAPKYGGYCAYAMSKGAKAPTDPNAWTIDNGKLYLNFSVAVRSIWQKDQAENIKKADVNWPNVR